MELEITWKRAARIWWSYLWRKIIAIIGAVIIGAIIGGVLGFILGMLGTSTDIIKLIVQPIVILIGLGISIIPLKLILGKNFGEFRLVLMSTSEESNT
jgi:ABC-type nitrate/sulfonate/bicarbonate transport system permease component